LATRARLSAAKWPHAIQRSCAFSSSLVSRTVTRGRRRRRTRRPARASDFASRVEPLSAERYRYEFSAGRSFHAKLEQARELLSHAVPDGDPAALLERALDALLERELKRRQGAGKPRQRRKLREGSRHVPARAKPTPDSVVFDKVRFALREMGFGKREIERVFHELWEQHAESAFDTLLRAALRALTPERPSHRGSHRAPASGADR
jgi:hypothetical protein